MLCDPTTRCWNWTHRVAARGYGVFRLTGHRKPARWIVAHRWSYENLTGQIPDALQLDHLCLNKRCVNPEHLEPVTNAENARRASVRQTECKRGHAFTPENVYLYRGRRNCRPCNLLRGDRLRRRRGARVMPQRANNLLPEKYRKQRENADQLHKEIVTLRDRGVGKEREIDL